MVYVLGIFRGTFWLRSVVYHQVGLPALLMPSGDVRIFMAWRPFNLAGGVTSSYFRGYFEYFDNTNISMLKKIRIGTKNHLGSLNIKYFKCCLISKNSSIWHNHCTLMILSIHIVSVKGSSIEYKILRNLLSKYFEIFSSKCCNFVSFWAGRMFFT